MSHQAEVTLRPFRVSDVDDFLEWAGDEAVTKYCRWDAYSDRESALDFLREVTESHPWYRAICVDGEPVGSIYVKPGLTGGKDERKAEIGYAMKARWWGKGIATRAVKLALSTVFLELKFLDRVEGLVFLENKASQRVLEKAGFVREGVLSRDIVVFSVVN